MESNHYAPPKAHVDGGFATEAAPAPWNPNGAANGGLLFTPIFGAWRHMKNREALGETGKAASARYGIVASVVVIPRLSCVDALTSSAALFGLARLGAFVLLIPGYFATGRPQARFVAERFGSDCPRKEWLAPLCIGVVAAFDYLVLVALLAFVADRMR